MRFVLEVTLLDVGDDDDVERDNGGQQEGLEQEENTQPDCQAGPWGSPPVVCVIMKV